MAITFISKEAMIVAVSLMGSGLFAWNDVTTDVQKNTTTIEQQENQNNERYEDLKEGQQHIQELIEQLLLEERKSNGDEG